MRPAALRLAVFFGFAQFLLGSAALAADEPTLELYATFHAVSVSVTVPGGSALVPSLFVGEGPGRRPGGRMYPAPPQADGATRWRASVFPLVPGQHLEVEVDLASAAGEPERTLRAAIQTRRFELPAPARTWHVKPGGLDSADGLSEASALGSINAALARATCGDAVLVWPGTYRERLDFTRFKCTEAAPLVVRRAASERPVLTHGTVLSPDASAWTETQTGVFVREVEVAEDKVVRVLTVDGKRAMRYVALDDLIDDDTSDLRLGRCYFEERVNASTRRIYLRPGTGDSPAAHAIEISLNEGAGTPNADNTGVNFGTAMHVVLDGFEIRHSGGLGLRFARNAANTAGFNMVTNCLIYHNHQNVQLNGGEGNAFWHNRLHQDGSQDFPWKAYYDARTEPYMTWTLLHFRGDRGLSVFDNDFYDGWDLVDTDMSLAKDALGPGGDIDILSNRFWNASDDAIEGDGPGTHQRIHANTLRGVLTAISLAPLVDGPTYVTRNTASYRGQVIKQGIQGDLTPNVGAVIVAHNTAFFTTRCEGGPAIVGHPARFENDPDDLVRPFANKYLFNNAWLTGSQTAAQLREGITMNHNAYSWAPGTSKPFRWWPDPDTKLTLDFAGFQDASGQEADGLGAAALDLGLVNLDQLRAYACPPSPAGLSAIALAEHPFRDEDLHLVPTSPLIDAAVPLAGINDAFCGEAPDVGAWEFEGAACEVPPKACDEDDPPRAERCGLGICQVEGAWRCVDGEERFMTQAGQTLAGCAPDERLKAAEACDGLDSDCDGIVDNAAGSLEPGSACETAPKPTPPPSSGPAEPTCGCGAGGGPLGLLLLLTLFRRRQR